jgi:cob(I)alamin adenosyltransferase
MKIYTKTGDRGETSLAIGGRVKKYDSRVELYGTADELNSTLGIVHSFLQKESELLKFIASTQNLLFELGSELAGYYKKDNDGKNIPIIRSGDIEEIEELMDKWSEKLTPLKNFVLPGGSHSAAFLHQARTVCRRLERKMVEEKDNGLDVAELSLIYVNRLSDALFLGARIANLEENFSEPIWVSRSKHSG